MKNVRGLKSLLDFLAQMGGVTVTKQSFFRHGIKAFLSVDFA